MGHSKFTKNHKIKLKDDLTRVDIASSKKQTKSVCNHHPDQEITAYCVSCESLLCNTCKHLSHINCNSVNIETVNVLINKKIVQEVSNTGVLISHFENIFEKITQTKRALENCNVEFQLEIENFLPAIKTTINFYFDKASKAINKAIDNAILLHNEKIKSEMVLQDSLVGMTTSNLQKLNDEMNYYKKLLSPLTPVCDKTNEINNFQPINIADITRVYNIQRNDTSEWKKEVNEWIESVCKQIKGIKPFPLLNSDKLVSTEEVSITQPVVPKTKINLNSIINELESVTNIRTVQFDENLEFISLNISDLPVLSDIPTVSSSEARSRSRSRRNLEDTEREMRSKSKPKSKIRFNSNEEFIHSRSNSRTKLRSRSVSIKLL